MRAYEVVAGSAGIDGLRRCERPEPQVAAGQILVRMRAVSLNYRDLMILRGQYGGGPVKQDTVPLSDGAGEVVAVGVDVSRFRVGDRVAGTFFRHWIDGPPLPGPRVALGAPPVDGVLADYVAFDEQDAVAIPAQLTLEQGATLPCAAVTAWHALVVTAGVRPGQTVVVLGTGGVSIFALQFARLAGARVLVTSSSDEKLAHATALGASGCINYRTMPDWDREVMNLTGGRGADCVVEVGGTGTLGRSMQALGIGGRILLIGVLTGRSGDVNPYLLMGKNASLHGIFVGSRAMFERMNAAIECNGMVPVIDRSFDFDEAAEAYRYLERGAHFGKIVIRL
jgi:NADPH:quinone reductase-like Zn-dependent oxidoreductase